MATITVYRPDVATQPAAPVPRAARGSVPADPVLLLIANGKPRARDLLERIAGEVSTRLPLGRVDVHNKPSAAKPIDADEARLMAARSHLVISGLGD
jgi:hypothetical protein